MDEGSSDGNAEGEPDEPDSGKRNNTWGVLQMYMNII